MSAKILPFPARVSSGLLTPEQQDQAAAALAEHYAAEALRQAESHAQPRAISPDQLAARLAYQQRLQQPTPNLDGVRVGDLFYDSWGWEQTNVNFYEVVALRGKHTAVIREIAGDYMGGVGWTGKKRPCRGEYIGPEYTVRTRLCDYFSPARPQLTNPELKGRKLDPTTDDAEHDYSTYG